MKRSPRLQRLLAWLVMPPVVAFVGLMSAAMAQYPGGTWEDPGERGASIVRTYFCDLLRPTALNGEANVFGAQLAEMGLLAFALALLPFFLIAPVAFPERRRLALVVRVAGVLASVGGLGIVLVPSHRFGALAHGVMVLFAAGPGLTAAVAVTVGAWLSRSRWIGWTALVTLATTAVCVAIFARQLALGTETTPGLALLQKVAVVQSLLWMGATVAQVLRPRRAAAVQRAAG